MCSANDTGQLLFLSFSLFNASPLEMALCFVLEQAKKMFWGVSVAYAAVF